MIPVLKHKHVLIADDDIAIRDLIAHTMEHEGCEVTEAGDGLLAFNSIMGYRNSKDKIDFLITDNKMPNITGVELINTLENNGISIPTIIVSGDNNTDIIDQLKNVKCIHFLKKPFRIEELLKEVLLVAGDYNCI